jgi:hypothetical protein
MLNDRLRDTTRSRLSSTHNEPVPQSPRVPCDGCLLVKTLDARLTTLESLQRADGLDLAELTGSVMASLEALKREMSTLSSSIDRLISGSTQARTNSDSFPAKANTVEAKMGDKWRFRSSGVVAIVITIIVAVAWVAKDWGPPTQKQQTTQSK